MKPLDLNVSIQNSYEAARSESVRLEKPHVVSQLANEDAQREQVTRDQSVVAPEPKLASEDMFAADEYEHSDYTERGGQGFKRRKRQKDTPEVKSETETKEGITETESPTKPEEERGKGFSTYA